jgi:hypothetical protein
LEKVIGSKKGQPVHVDRLPNWPINFVNHLAEEICFFAGDEAYTDSVIFGILQTSVLMALALWMMRSTGGRKRTVSSR